MEDICQDQQAKQHTIAEAWKRETSARWTCISCDVRSVFFPLGIPRVNSHRCGKGEIHRWFGCQTWQISTSMLVCRMACIQYHVPVENNGCRDYTSIDSGCYMLLLVLGGYNQRKPSVCDKESIWIWIIIPWSGWWFQSLWKILVNWN